MERLKWRDLASSMTECMLCTQHHGGPLRGGQPPWDKQQQWKNLKRLFCLADTISCNGTDLLMRACKTCKKPMQQKTHTSKPHGTVEWRLSKQTLFVSVSTSCRCPHPISKIRIISENQVNRNTLFSDASSAECSKTTQRKCADLKVRAVFCKNHPKEIQGLRWPDWADSNAHNILQKASGARRALWSTPENTTQLWV